MCIRDRARVAELMLQVSGWALVEDGHALSKTFGFDNYYQTMALSLIHI